MQLVDGEDMKWGLTRIERRRSTLFTEKDGGGELA
jgi:hypothetical protein